MSLHLYQKHKEAKRLSVQVRCPHHELSLGSSLAARVFSSQNPSCRGTVPELVLGALPDDRT